MKAQRIRSGICAGMALLLWAAVAPPPALAVLDNRDRGPSLTGGNFSLRITNAGIVGNAFFDVGLSMDPSFEFPIHSGHEALHYAALWVGALDDHGDPHVSGGTLLEFRPTTDPEDRVLLAERGRLGAERRVDDDGDGREDEEILNGRDDDADGETDEDLGLFAQQIAVADYVDDRPEAVLFVPASGEIHQPLGLSVRQEAYAWGASGYDGIAGLRFTITNHGTRELRQLHLGLYADLDSRDREDRAGHVNDRVTSAGYSRTLFDGISFTTLNGTYPRNCVPGGGCAPWACNTTLAQTLPALVDGNGASGLPAVAVLPLDHTIDPLARLEPAAARRWARAPAAVSFRATIFANGRPVGRGGPPTTDAARYQALAGTFQGADTQVPGDYAVLVSCGPFATLAPGQSLELVVALIAAADVELLETAMGDAAVLYHGARLNLLPDHAGSDRGEWNVGETGLNGHDTCLEPPPGVTFRMDPHCLAKFVDEGEISLAAETTYVHGSCIWTDTDCDECTGLNGFETIERWLEPGWLPPRPGLRLTALDHAVRIEWDNLPEILFNAGLSLPEQHRAESRFIGYRVWKMADWRQRHSLVPDRSRWALWGGFGPDTATGQVPLPRITNDSLDYVRILYEQRQYPVGRYAVTDTEVLNGFEYMYVVTSLYEIVDRTPGGALRVRRVESAIDADFTERIAPQEGTRPGAGGVWVVPNPYRGYADWQLPRTLGDPLTRHIDFMGLPRALCTIRVWTVAGDLVAQIDHDGRGGDGQAEWDLISRNGQEVVSGIYLFSVDSDLGHQVGRFVVVR